MIKYLVQMGAIEMQVLLIYRKRDSLLFCFRYVRALGAFYLRLVHSSLDCYNYLEPLLNDYRKLRSMNRNGQFELTHMDEFIDNLLREDRINDIVLPRIQKRFTYLFILFKYHVFIFALYQYLCKIYFMKNKFNE